MLFPTVLREILLGAADRGLYQPIWSERILQEWVRATAKLGPVAQMQAEGEAVMLRARFPKANMRAFPEIEARLLLPDANDLHVLALGIGGHADCIVTVNNIDFPRHVLAAEGLSRRDPDSLLWELWSHHPDEIEASIGVVHATAQRISGQEIPLKSLLKRAQLPKLAKSILA